MDESFYSRVVETMVEGVVVADEIKADLARNPEITWGKVAAEWAARGNAWEAVVDRIGSFSHNRRERLDASSTRGVCHYVTQ